MQTIVPDERRQLQVENAAIRVRQLGCKAMSGVWFFWISLHLLDAVPLPHSLPAGDCTLHWSVLGLLKIGQFRIMAASLHVRFAHGTSCKSPVLAENYI